MIIQLKLMVSTRSSLEACTFPAYRVKAEKDFGVRPVSTPPMTPRSPQWLPGTHNERLNNALEEPSSLPVILQSITLVIIPSVHLVTEDLGSFHSYHFISQRWEAGEGVQA